VHQTTSIDVGPSSTKMLIRVLQVSAANRYSKQIIMYVGLIFQELGVSAACRYSQRVVIYVSMIIQELGSVGWQPIIAGLPASRNSRVTQSSQSSSASTATP
jgi:hypothetical protein